MRASRPSVDYLANCSQSALESLELSRLNAAANLRKHFHQVLSELIEQEVDARIARAILDWRRTQHDSETNIEVPLLACLEASSAQLLPTPEQMSMVFETSKASPGEFCEPLSVETIAPSSPQTSTVSRTAHRPQIRQLYAGKTLSLARAAVSSGTVVESLADGHRQQRYLPAKSIKRGGLRWISRSSAPSAPSICETIASNSNLANRAARESLAESLASTQPSPAFLGSPMTNARPSA